jgi:hypothetical protein
MKISGENLAKTLRVSGGVVVAISTSWAIDVWWSGYFYSTPYGTQDFIGRLLGCLIGTIFACFLSHRHSSLVVLALVLFFAVPDASRILSFWPIDWYPLEDYLSFNAARVVWFLEFVIATLLGSLAGRWVGRRLRNSILSQTDSSDELHARS